MDLIPHLKSRELRVRFQVTGNLSKIDWPPQRTSEFKSELWKNTCFEVFYFSSQSDAYIELNLSPSSEWWAAQFSSYRNREKELPDDLVPNIQFSKKPDHAFLQAEIPLRDQIRLGLAAVIQCGAQTHYFALQHSDTKPDFHLKADAFIELNDLEI